MTHKALPPAEGGVETFAHLIVLKKHGTFMLAFDPKDEKKKGLSFYGRPLATLVPTSTGPYPGTPTNIPHPYLPRPHLLDSDPAHPCPLLPCS